MSIYRVIKSQDYVTMANFHLRDKRLTMAAKGLLSVLLADEGDNAYTVAELAERGPEGKDAIRSSLSKLEACGYIRRSQRHGPSGRFSGNEFLIYEAPLSENPTTVKPSSGKPLTENPTTVAEIPDIKINDYSSRDLDSTLSSLDNKEDLFNTPHKSPQKKPSGRGVSVPSWEPERFAAFWKFYPRGESKQAAIRAWDKLRPSPELIATMGRALQRQMETEEWKRGIGIPYASTWLNQRRWEDELRECVPAKISHVEERSDVVYWEPGMEL